MFEYRSASTPLLEHANHGVNHLVRTHVMGKGPSKSVRQAFKGERAEKSKYACKSPFFIHFVIFMIVFLPLKYFSVFFFMKLLIGYLKRFQLELGGGGVRCVRVHTQWGHGKRTFTYVGGGSKFAVLVSTY